MTQHPQPDHPDHPDRPDRPPVEPHRHATTAIERHCDVAVIGGSAAGLAAAFQLGRQRRSVIVVDAGEPRNAPAAHMHGYLGHEAIAPSDFTDIARREVRSYGVEVLSGRATGVTRLADGRFQVALTGGSSIVARRVLAATGLIDELPDIEGVAEHWGRDVIHCPFCHGYEVRDQRVVQVVTHPMGLHSTPLFRQLTEQLTVVFHSGVAADHPDLQSIRQAGVRIVESAVRRIVTGTDGRLASVELANGDALEADAVVVGAGFRARTDAFHTLGLETVEHPSGLGDHLVTDSTGETSVPGCYAAGNVADPSQQVLHAAANGSWVGAMISFGLAREDLATDSRASANEIDWDHRYGGDRLWSGNPNGTLVAEVDGMTPGRVLDVGAGEGGDAVWLAEHGWTVTASDVSERALGRVAAIASERGVSIECMHADANASSAYGSAEFDLVSAQYASIPRTPDGRGIANVLGAVAPGGTLLVVSHDLEPMRMPIDTREHSRPFDADAYVRVEDFLAVLAASPEWQIETHERRPRPAGAASTHHVDDVILRAHKI